MSYKSPRGSRKAVNPYTWLVCAKIVKFGRGEGDPTSGSMFSAGHEPAKTVLLARGVGREPTQGSVFGAGYEPTQGNAFGAGHEPTQTDPWDRRRGSAQPTGPY